MNHSPPAAANARPLLIALIVAIAFFMETLDSTIIVTALPHMARSFDIDVARLSIGVTAYLMAAAVCVTASGWLADRIGSRTLFCGAIGVFTIASVICGMAQDFSAFIAGRVLQGVAAAMMSPVGRLVVLRTSQKKDLGRALSALIWPGLAAPVIGPPLGGFITDMANWRWIFYVNVPVGLIGMALVMAYVPNEKQAPRPFDRKGFLLMAVALGALTYGLDLLGMRQQQALYWGAGLVVLASVLGVMVHRHLSSAQHPLVNPAIFKVRSFFISSVTGGVISRAAISATPFLLPLMFQLAYGMTPLQSGSLLLAYMLANLLMKTVTTPILAAVGIRNALIWSSIVSGLGIALCGFVSPAADLALNIVILAFAGAGRSMQLTAITMVNFADIPPPQRQPASVLSSLTQQIGMGAGVAVGALLLTVGQTTRGAPALALPDFQLALVLAGVISASAAWFYAGLARDVGDEISGRAQGPAR
ncbi:MFS transporter [Duganella sp. FT80W]|uniref:MFS transporter n=1 Tax=Duganella guangzhouensis TaxID=2666084 RepID=A0A6I2KWG0_9BURK|nr:MFS transporter [Duganella guangzhouensis]MRW88536.1 MFS transporter [Duganella guangzhouensis]